jgi:hypothetical protein
MERTLSTIVEERFDRRNPHLTNKYDIFAAAAKESKRSYRHNRLLARQILHVCGKSPKFETALPKFQKILV